MREIPYDRVAAVAYARKWTFLSFSGNYFCKSANPRCGAYF